MSVNSVTTSMEATYSAYSAKADSAKKADTAKKTEEPAAVSESSA